MKRSETHRGDAATLRGFILGFRRTQLIGVAARLGLADELRHGPRSAEDLARATGADVRALPRVLRALASEGVFAETADGRFDTTPLAELLRSDAPGSMRAMAVLYGEPWMWQAYGALSHSVRTGRTAFEHVHGSDFYGFLKDHPSHAELFQQAMTAFTAHEVAAIASACDLAGASTLVDVGAGHGALAAALLTRHPRLNGIVFDLPAVIAGARRALDEAGLLQRCTCIAGDFFESVPSGGDIYLMKSVLHNWDDESASRILRRCAAAMHERARLIVVESVIPPGNDASEAKLFDINMMVTAGGQERTEAEYRALLHAAGLRLVRTTATPSPLSLIEAILRERRA
jgi:precorrin-6B methylase 2